jgi:hypothetical protein
MAVCKNDNAPTYLFSTINYFKQFKEQDNKSVIPRAPDKTARHAPAFENVWIGSLSLIDVA